MNYAVRQGYLGRNPTELVDAPPPVKRLIRTLTPAEVAILFETAQDNKYYPVIYTAVNTGFLQAELLGLRWRDIDLDMLSISVSQVLYKGHGVCEFKEPKAEHSRRRVAMTLKLALFLKVYKLERELLGMLNLDSLVFSNLDNNPIDPSVLSHDFVKIVKCAGLENISFHDLKHTFASFMLLRGAKPKVTSEALGHSSVAFTMDTYSHIIEGMQSDAMALLNEVLPVGVSRKNNANLTQVLPKIGVNN
ncbi:tyrosine-type recombinase/integrase [Chloroflexota bacterium]